MNSTNYTLRLATPEDAYAIWSVMDTCYQAMEHKEHFLCDDLDYVKDILYGQGFGVVACDFNEKIVGNLLVKYPGLTDENLGYDIFGDSCQECDIPLSTETLMQVLHMDSASVLPTHRSHGLERQMIAYAESKVDTSKYRDLLATVAPENTASLKSLLRLGYRVITTKEKYGKLMRCIMMKALY